MPDPNQKPRPAIPNPGGGGGGSEPHEPQVERPNTDDLLKRMKKVDPDQAKRYRQRTGE
ncbi:MAG: ubiquitin-like protein UBact [Verrucomicrobiota bacterium]|nr:ubiquitin-like protein UBact [Verrucomicrobiota bacterium]